MLITSVSVLFGVLEIFHYLLFIVRIFIMYTFAFHYIYSVYYIDKDVKGK